MNWFFLTIISAVTYAGAEIIGKYVSDEKSEPVFIGIIAAIFTTLVTLGLTTLEIVKMPTNIWAIIGLIISAALVAIGIITYYEGLKNSDISEFGLLSRSRALIIVLGGVVIFRERFNFFQILGGLMVLYGVFLLSWKGGKFHFGKGAKFALATAILFSLGSLFDKAVISHYSAMMYTFLVYLFTVLFMFPFAWARYSEGAKLPNKTTIYLLLIIGILYGLSAYCIYAAYLANGPISLVTLVSQLEIPLTVLWGILIFKEKKRILPKLISMVLLIVGIILLK